MWSQDYVLAGRVEVKAASEKGRKDILEKTAAIMEIGAPKRRRVAPKARL